MLEQLMCPPAALCALSLTDAMMENLKRKFAWWRSLIKCCYLTEARKVSVMKTGEGGRENMQSHQSKQRAFQTFIVVTSTVWLSFAGLLVSNVVYWSPQVSNRCSGGWCILVLPAQLFSLTSAVSAQGRETLKLLFKQWANPYFSNNILLDLSVFCFVFPNIQNVWGGKHDFLFREKRISGFLH